MLSSLYPTLTKNGNINWQSSSYLDSTQSSISNLLIATHNYVTPKDLARMAWSFVDPPSQPFSKPPVCPSMTNTAHSACAAPDIMFDIKSTCPGASIIVKFLFLVLKKACAVFIVIPCSLSS